MRLMRLTRLATLLASGAILVQLGGCTPTATLDFIQTILLGVTAAGAVVIMREV